MTAILAWIQDNDGFIIADSAVTRNGQADPRKAISSIGQRARPINGRIVEEGAAKLFRIGNNAIIGICGKQEPAVAFIREIISVARMTDDLELATKIASSRASVFSEDFEAIILVHCDGRTHILVFSSETGLLRPAELGVWASGSLSDEHTLALVKDMPNSRSGPMPPADRLAAALAVAQAYGVHNDLIPHRVGGTFFGAHLGAEGARWQDDIVYIIYQPELLESVRARPTEMRSVEPGGMEFVCSRVRDDALTVVSTHTKQVRVFTSDFVTPDLVAWQEKWQPELENMRTIEASKRLVFVPVLTGSFVVLPNDGRFFRWTERTVMVHSGLAKRLTWKPTKDRPRRFDIHL